MILDALNANLDEILERLRPSYLGRYGMLRDRLLLTDVSIDREYQRTFNGFYRMQRRERAWYAYYFALLQRNKTDETVDFANVIRQIHADRQRVEPSFASKLVATIRPEMPVYDRYVRDNLSLRIPAASLSTQTRIDGFITTYESLHAQVRALISNRAFTDTLRPAFDGRFPSYASITDVKKLDFLLWQYRVTRARPNLRCSRRRPTRSSAGAAEAARKGVAKND